MNNGNKLAIITVVMATYYWLIYFFCHYKSVDGNINNSFYTNRFTFVIVGLLFLIPAFFSIAIESKIFRKYIDVEIDDLPGIVMFLIGFVLLSIFASGCMIVALFLVPMPDLIEALY